jgi:hypothetical protein
MNAKIKSLSPELVLAWFSHQSPTTRKLLLKYIESSNLISSNTYTSK